MVTEAQILANRLNAQKSTGPRTAEGKAAVAQNAVKHGLSGRADVIKGEDQAEFDQHRETLLGELAPVGPMESMLAERVVSLSWRLKRVACIQNEVFDALLADRNSPLAKLVRSLEAKAAGRPKGEVEAEEEDFALGRAVIKDFSNSRVLDRLLMYERRLEHSLYKTMAELQRLQVLHEMDGAAKRESTTETPSARRDGQSQRGTPTGFHPPDPLCLRGEDSCKTKPISAGANQGQVPCDTGVREASPEGGVGETKPITAAGTLGTARSADEAEFLGQPHRDFGDEGTD